MKGKGAAGRAARPQAVKPGPQCALPLPGRGLSSVSWRRNDRAGGAIRLAAGRGCRDQARKAARREAAVSGAAPGPESPASSSISATRSARARRGRSCSAKAICPAIETAPRKGRASPAISRNRVVLPATEGPGSTRNSPAATVNVTSSPNGPSGPDSRVSSLIARGAALGTAFVLLWCGEVDLCAIS